jgi:hypothetical protein
LVQCHLAKSGTLPLTPKKDILGITETVYPCHFSRRQRLVSRRLSKTRISNLEVNLLSMMKNSLAILQNAQQALNELALANADTYEYELVADDARSRLLFADLGNGLAIEFYGEVWEEAFDIFLDAICRTEVAGEIRSLRITGPDEGANGLRTHDFAPLLKTGANFPKAVDLYIRPTDVCDHNLCEVNDNQIPALIERFPNLQNLTLPNAPEETFFNIPLNQCRYLRIGMGFRLHRFITNLAKSNNLPRLTLLDFCDSLSVFHVNSSKQSMHPNLNAADELLKTPGYDNSTLADAQKSLNDAFQVVNSLSTYDDSYTSFVDYHELLNSPVLKRNALLHLRNAYLTEDQFLQLQKIRPDLQLSLSMEAPHVYISHWPEKFNKPFKHLIINR